MRRQIWRVQNEIWPNQGVANQIAVETVTRQVWAKDDWKIVIEVLLITRPLSTPALPRTSSRALFPDPHVVRALVQGHAALAKPQASVCIARSVREQRCAGNL